MTARAGAASGLELWGGAECTVNRVGDIYRDQTHLSGHQHRPEDLDLFAALGVRRLRYPVLWERVAPDGPDRCDWTWSDERLARIRRLGMVPIVSLLHHGSGPRHTSLVDDAFPVLFGRYAGAVAARYPDVADWTPINEPLTTARFSALYGHWYPHARDERLFWAALLNQIDGTRAAMRAIRAVNPAARLIQTEDLGRCYATDALAGVADHYNDRRWMTWDLLAGWVVSGHPLWPHLDGLGFGDRLRAIADDPCPADVIGVNHYITSDRFLDDRRHAHAEPLPAVGFHDVSAVRALDPAPTGLRDAIAEAWDRYRTPVAVTECHLSCTREEQVRWLHQAWQDCLALRADGVDVAALTAWALLGSTDWNSLLTRSDGQYETGAFDVRGGAPQATAIASLLASLGGGASPVPGVAAVVTGRGWWQRDDLRLEHPPYRRAAPRAAVVAAPAGAPLLIVGATGTLGQALAGICRMRGIAHVLADRAALPLDHPRRVAAALDRYRPWAVVNAAGWVRVDDAEDDRATCHAANAEGARNLTQACARRGIHCTLFSSDLVFDGTRAPYREADPASPLNVYGHSKAQVEREAVDGGGNVLVVRTAAFFSPHDSHNFAMAMDRELRAGRPFGASPDHVVSPTYVPDLVQACLDLVVDGAIGVRHLTNGEAVSWLAFARRLAAALGLDAELVVPAAPASLGWRALRPLNVALRSSHGVLLPPLDDAIARFAGVRSDQVEQDDRVACLA